MSWLACLSKLHENTSYLAIKLELTMDSNITARKDNEFSPSLWLLLGLDTLQKLPKRYSSESANYARDVAR